MLTPSPKISPPSAMISPRLIPIRIATRCSFGIVWFRRTAASRRAPAQRAASTTLSNSISTKSLVCLKIFPSNSGTSGSMTSVKKALSPEKLSFSSPGNSRL